MHKYKGFIIQLHGSFAMWVIKKEGKGTLFKKLGGLFRTPMDAKTAIDSLPKKPNKEKNNGTNQSTPRG